MAITQIYIPLYVGFPRDPKVRALVVHHGVDGILAAYLYIMMALYCRENLTDGHVPDEEIGALAYPLPLDHAEQLIKLLTEQELIKRLSNGQSVSWLVLAYVKRNGTREQVETLIAQRVAAGKIGGQRTSSARQSKQVPSSGSSTGSSQTESKEGKSTSARARGRAGAGARDGQDDDDDESLNTIAAMLRAHGPISAEQVARYRDSLLIGRTIEDPARYVIGAIRRDSVKAYREAVAAKPASSRSRQQPPPPGAMCPRCARTDHRAEDCPTGRESTGADDLAGVARVGGPALARELLAKPEPPPAVEHAEPLPLEPPATATAARVPQPGDADWTPPF